MADGKFISYLRVSTDKQGRSGLGLEAQQEAVKNFLNGGNWTLLEEFVEVESGRKNDRPILARALAACRKHKASLVVAKVDRLARDVDLVRVIYRDKRVNPRFCDFPNLPEGPEGLMFLTNYVAFGEFEAALISIRTKAALAAAKRRGVVLGNPANLTPEARIKGAASGRAGADAFALQVAPVLKELAAQGITTQLGIAKALDERGIPTARGGEWTNVQVGRLLSRLAA